MKLQHFLAATAAVLSILHSALAGLSPESVVVVVNADNWASITVANEYARLRQIPASNIVMLSGLSAFDAMGPDQFRGEVLGPVLAAIDARGLRAQVDCITYSVDLPSVIWVQSDMQGHTFPQVITAAASANSVTYLHELFMQKDTAYLDLTINRYSRRTLPLATGEPLSAAAREAYARGIKLYDEKQFREASAIIAPLVEQPCNDAGVYYNLACCQALAGEHDNAMASLTHGVSIGWRNHGQIASDPDLESLRERSDFRALLTTMQARAIEVQETRGFRGSTNWSAAGDPAETGPRYLLSTMLGVTAGRGNSVNEVLECLRRAERADDSKPDGTVYIMRNGDVRSTTREWAFAALVTALKKLGVNARIEDGVLPTGKKDVAGAVVGIADFKWSDAGSVITQGAICEHLTSCGGMMGERDGQTPCTDFIRAGAAGSSGAVTEPYALQAKFPSPFLHAHYARGCTLAEAYYQSLEGPYQLLIIGDPLCRPWGTKRAVTVEGVSRGATLKSMVALKPHSTGTPAVARFALFVDGVRAAECALGEELPLDPNAYADGAHLLSIVATRGDLVESRDRLAFPVIFASHGRPSVEARATGKAISGKPILVEVACDGAKGIDLLHLGRVVGHAEGSGGTVMLDSARLGTGKIELQAVALCDAAAPNHRVLSAPFTIEIELPLLKGGRTPKGTTAGGLAFSTGKNGKVAVSDTFDATWIAPLAIDAKSFEVTGYFDVPTADLYQLHIATNTESVVEIDGVKLLRAGDSAWHSAPARLTAGTHRLRITGVAPTRAADARMDLRIGCAGIMHPSAARFRCELK